MRISLRFLRNITAPLSKAIQSPLSKAAPAAKATLVVATAALGAPALSSCSMMHDDTDDCPTGLYVRFVYDYNIDRADMFKDHVGHVMLYVYNEDGVKVAEKGVSNTDAESPLARYGYMMHFDPTELAPGRYRLVAVGMQRDWDEAAATQGAKMRRPAAHNHYSELQLALDHDGTPNAEGHHHVQHAGAPLDTVWHTLKVMAYDPMDGDTPPDMHRTKAPFTVYPLEEQYVTVAKERATYATVSMIRDTKHINLTLRQIDDPADMHAEDYEVSIVADNATLDHDNAVITGRNLRYSPYTSWTSRFDSNGTVVEDPQTAPRRSRADEDPNTQRTAHYNLMTNRLMHDATNHNANARLRIVNRETGDTVANINLPSMLQEGRIAYDLYNYSAQEYLDREHDYHLQMFLKGDKWLYCDIVINVLSWARRVQNVEL